MANIFLQGNEGRTPLYDAINAFVNDIENIEMLLRHHADVNARLHNGATPLDLATRLERIMKLDLPMEHLGRTHCAEMIQLLRRWMPDDAMNCFALYDRDSNELWTGTFLYRIGNNIKKNI